MLITKSYPKSMLLICYIMDIFLILYAILYINILYISIICLLI